MNESLKRKLLEEFRDKEYADSYLDDFLNSWIATQIKVVREQRGLTQGGLADLCDMKQERISLLEDVEYGSWSIKTLQRIAHALDVALNVSFEEVGKRIDDIAAFSRESLQRLTREESLAKCVVDETTSQAPEVAAHDIWFIDHEFAHTPRELLGRGQRRAIYEKWSAHEPHGEYVTHIDMVRFEPPSARDRSDLQSHSRIWTALNPRQR